MPAPTSGRPATVSSADEAYRILRSTVKFAAGDGPVRSVLVVDIDRATSSGVARELAAAFARAGDRCVLVEADPRAAAGRDDPGFSDLLSGAAPVGAVVQTADLPLLGVVGPGTLPNADLLAGERLSESIGVLPESHRHVVLACASLPQHGDALAIAPRVDATLLVVTAGQTRRPRAIEARDALARVGANLLGVVMLETKRRWFW
jgi:non-specific protein-tyrosine kinase